MNIIPESDVYRLIMRSRLPDAERFQDWVCEDVLPSIRKTGIYSIAGIPVPRFDSPADAARAWADLFEAKVIAEKKAALETARADYAIATKGQIVQGRDQRLMQQRHEDIKALNRKDERNGRLDASLHAVRRLHDDAQSWLDAVSAKTGELSAERSSVASLMLGRGEAL